MFIFCTLAWLCVFSLQFQCPKTIDVAAVFAQEITKGDDSFFFFFPTTGNCDRFWAIWQFFGPTALGNWICLFRPYHRGHLNK